MSTHPLAIALDAAGVSMRYLSTPTATVKDAKGWEHYHWPVVVRCNDRKQETATIDYKCGIGHARTVTRGYKIPKQPSREDVVASLLLDSSACDVSFDDWCGDYGYSTDSREALETYLACQSYGGQIRRVLGSHLKAVQEAAADY
jgi:hypothetical protein